MKQNQPVDSNNSGSRELNRGLIGSVLALNLDMIKHLISEGAKDFNEALITAAKFHIKSPKRLQIMNYLLDQRGNTENLEQFEIIMKKITTKQITKFTTIGSVKKPCKESNIIIFIENDNSYYVVRARYYDDIKAVIPIKF